MDLKDYTEQIVNAIKEKYPDYEITSNTVRKNNNVILHAIIIKESDTNIAPTIYVDPMADRNMSIEDAVDRVVEIYEENKVMGFQFDPNTITKFDDVKDKIVARVYGKKSNEDDLDRCPYAQFGDLIVNFHILINARESDCASIKVTNEIMNNWKVSLSTLLQYAYENTPKLTPLVVTSMIDVLKEMSANSPELEELLVTQSFEEDNVMYIISNDTKLNGAFYITDREALKTVSEKLNDSFYILPSSIHELIAIPAAKSQDEASMLEMVKEVNATQVAPTEVLTDNIYFYNRDDETICGSDHKIIPFLS